MRSDADHTGRRDRAIAALLRTGTWLACALIAAGLALMAAGPPDVPVDGHDLMKAGVAVFIVLPVSRVALMLCLFVRERDYAYAAIAALVLAVIAAGVMIEM